MTEVKRVKRVGIIGAGPSGLIAAHTFLGTPDTFKVTIFEKTHQICGLWPTAKYDNERMIDPLMRANQSKHTVSFGSVGQGLYEKYKEDWDEEVDIFPKAWQVGRYLRKLCDEVTTAGASLRLNTEAVSVEKVQDGLKNGEAMKWRVRTRSTHQPQCVASETEAEMYGKAGEEVLQEEEHIFDHLIIASGFFGTPKIPAELRPFLSTITSPSALSPNRVATPETKTMESPLGIPVIHSSSFRSLTSLLASSPPLPSAAKPRKRKILVVGGSMSGAEAASACASELSSLQHSPGPSALPNPDQYEVLHIASRPFWTLPRYLPLNAKEASPTFLPLDFVLFNLATRPPGTLGTNRSGKADWEAARKGNEMFKSLSGQERPHGWFEGDVGKGNGHGNGEGPVRDRMEDVVWLGICDDYSTHSLSGNIRTERGRLTGLAAVDSTSDQETNVSATILTPNGDKNLDNVAAVILATGFSSTNSLAFMDDNMRRKLDFKPDSYVPLLLSWQSTLSSSFPTLGFVGMYNGPFWGVMEQQAILLRETWAMMDGRGEEREEVQWDLARGVKHAGTDVPLLRQIEEGGGAKGRLTQFPMGDYIHVISDLLSLRGKKIGDVHQEAVCWPLVPDVHETDMYSKATDESARMSEGRQAVQHVVGKGLAGRFFPRTLFRALLGKWKLERTITSKHPSYPSGTLTGTATFHPRAPTEKGYCGEYLFIEEGEFKTDNGLVLKASRRYVWRLKSGKNGENDKVSQWFVKVDGPERGVGVDYLFHELEIIKPDGVALSIAHEVMDGSACPKTNVATERAETPDLYASATEDEEEARGRWSFSSKANIAADAREMVGNVKETKGLWGAKGHHLCIDDTYDPEYVFRWKGAELEEWEMGYTVKGPGKDYYIHSRFTRPS